MNSSPKVLWLVTARSGSVSVPHKNIKELGGTPLLAYRISAASKIAASDDIWISTDSQHYADIAAHYGAKVPFIRPAHLATSTSLSSDVVLHAMDVARQQQRNYDAIGLLEPTSPFVYPSDLQTALEILFADPQAHAVVASRQVRPSTFYIQAQTKYLDVLAKRIRETGFLRRQDEHREITPSGGFYIARWEAFLRYPSFYAETTIPYLVPEECGLEIDEPLDWDWAEFLIQKKKVDLTRILGDVPSPSRPPAVDH